MLLGPVVFILFFVLHPESAVENGPIENLQVLILAAGAVAAWFAAQRAETSQGRHIWYCGTVVFLILIGRELSWGRVFYPEGVSRLDLWYGPFIYPFLGIVSAILVAVLVRNRIDRYVVRRGVPVYDLLVFTGFLLLSDFADNKILDFFVFPKGQLLEELAECVCYSALVSMAFIMGIEKTGLVRSSAFNQGRFASSLDETVTLTVDK